MKSFYVYSTGAALLLIAGVIASVFNEKAEFLIWLGEWRSPVADYFFYYVTLLGESYPFIFFGILLWLQSWKKMLTVPVLGLVVSLTSFLLKLFFQHERPSLYLERIGWEGSMSILGYPVIGGYHSFPSGHSMAAWAIFTLMAAHVKKTWFSFLCLFFAIAVSISRIYLVVHFLQDVVVGAMVGFAMGYGIYYAYSWWIKKIQKKNQQIAELPGQMVDTNS